MGSKEKSQGNFLAYLEQSNPRGTLLTSISVSLPKFNPYQILRILKLDLQTSQCPHCCSRSKLFFSFLYNWSPGLKATSTWDSLLSKTWTCFCNVTGKSDVCPFLHCTIKFKWQVSSRKTWLLLSTMTPLFSLRQKVSERVLLNIIIRRWSRIITPQADRSVAVVCHGMWPLLLVLHTSTHKVHVARGAALCGLSYLDILQHMGTQHQNSYKPFPAKIQLNFLQQIDEARSFFSK